MRIGIASLFVFAIALGNAACSTDPEPRRDQPLAAKQKALVTVQFYDEAGKAKGSCAGVLVGPQAVLTAGHCAANKGHAVVTAPNAGGKKAESHRAWWFDWTNQATPKKAPQLHDVAILALDTPITLKKYPDVADEPLKEGTKTLQVRRVKGKGKAKIAFEATMGVAHPQKKARGHYYKLDQTKGSLDSGAPVFDAKTGKIVGVTSTQGKSRALYVTKTKSLTKWLRQQLLALLESPPKPPAPTSTTAPKPPASSTPSTPSTPPASKPPTGGSPSGGSPSGGSSKPMGKQSGKSTKAAGKPASKPSSQQPQKPTTQPGNCDEKSGGGEGGSESSGASAGGEGGCNPNPDDCNNSNDGDMNCTPGVCGAAEQSSSSEDNCSQPCEGGDQSCQDPQCNESESCDCQGEEQCGGNQDDPFEDNQNENESNDDQNSDQENDQTGDQDESTGDDSNDIDSASEDLADDADYGDQGDTDSSGSDDYSESGYDDSGSEDTGSEDTGSEESSDYGGEDNGGYGDTGYDDTGSDYGGDDYGGE